MADDELFSFFSGPIVNREITCFSALVELSAPLARDARRRPVLMRAFELIRALNWGCFAPMRAETHRRLWKEVVIPAAHFPGAGDLKRTLSISSLYVAMLDIHGYTQFCQDARKNLSRLHSLDRVISGDIQTIAARSGAVCRRERGDEIVVIAAAASDALTVTLDIIGYFGKKAALREGGGKAGRSLDAHFLPPFRISAGITGGNTSSPLIITEEGSLSGFLLNSGARLQVRAGELSPDESRVMVSRQVQMNFLRENAAGAPCALFRKDAVYFMDAGIIGFKGGTLPVSEAVFDRAGWYKKELGAELSALYAAVNGNLWEQKVYPVLMELLVKTAAVMPAFSLAPVPHGAAPVTNAVLSRYCRAARSLWTEHEDYIQAVNALRDITGVLEHIPRFDRLILDYARGIAERYGTLVPAYTAELDREVERNSTKIYPPDQHQTWKTSRAAVRIYEKLRAEGRKRLELIKKKTIWYNLIKANAGRMKMTLYSGKK
jgi:hypothetical protein